MELSVCIIVKNEEKCLRILLERVKNFADEIIITDTGSVDRTKEIAKEYTDKVFDFIWQNDFSKARNFCFSKATKDFVMWLDADDYIDENNIRKLNALKNNLSADCYMLKYAIAFQDKVPTFEYFRERILRRSFGFVWKGFIHEAITPAGKIEYLDITIEHHKKAESDPKRNLLIYRAHKKMGEIFDARSQYYYSKELFYNEFFRQAILELKKFLKMDNSYLPNIQDAIFTILICFNELDLPQKAIDFACDFLKTNIPTSEICCEVAKSFLKMGKPNNAIFFYQMALSCQFDLKSGAFFQSDFYYFIPHIQLAYLLFEKDYQKARYYHGLAKVEKPNHPAVILNEKFFQI